MSDVRVRFAPSPTGHLHIGGLRTALFNWLFARRHGGKFIVRIEDTDRDRSTDAAIDAIVNGMRWVGLDWDEGPHRQSDRLDLYRQKALALLERGQAYWCVCTPEELEARRKEAQAKGEPLKYDGRCRERGLTASAEPAALRFRSPQEGQTVVEDLIKGTIVFENTVLDDLIILRSNGYPTYNLSVVIDDALMEITHVIRGDDHVNNTPRQVPLFEALEYPVPKFAHLPMILGSDKSRLSKRHGATSVLAYQEMGYLPEALVNYLVRLGWSHGDQEIFSIQEMIEKFSFDHVQSSAAVFNPEKLQWLNAEYIKQAEPRHIADLLLPFLEKQGMTGTDSFNPKVALKRRSLTCVSARKHWSKWWNGRCLILRNLWRWMKPRPESSHPRDWPQPQQIRRTSEDGRSLFQRNARSRVANHPRGRPPEDGEVRPTPSRRPYRRTFSPGIYEVMELLGKDRTLKRIEQALHRIPAS